MDVVLTFNIPVLLGLYSRASTHIEVYELIQNLDLKMLLFQLSHYFLFISCVNTVVMK